MPIDSVTCWIGIGLILLLAELHFSGFSLFFAGLGAITTGLALHAGVIGEDGLVQFPVFFIASALWAVLLWKPLQRFRIGHNHGHYSHMIGETAQVGPGGLGKSGGEVLWSGTVMKALLAANAPVDRLEAGTPVTVAGVKGATLTVMPIIN